MIPLEIAGGLQVTSTRSGLTNLTVTSRGAEGAGNNIVYTFNYLCKYLYIIFCLPGGRVEMVAAVEYELCLESTVTVWMLMSYDVVELSPVIV